MQYKILGIDTSCDETSASVIYGSKVLSNVMPSQTEIHAQYGGVMPSAAKLAHIERIDAVINKALKLADTTIEEIDFIAATYGPGLAIALEVGLKKGIELAQKYDKPLIAINHMEGHLFSSLVKRNSSNSKEEMPEFPVLGFLVSGNHTEIVLVKDFGEYEILGETVDDACGECFDKCGRTLGLGYPAGPVISKLAKENRKNFKLEMYNDQQSKLVRATNLKTKISYTLPIPMANSADLNFSYSGLKTAFKNLYDSIPNISKNEIIHLAVLFEEAALKQLEIKIEKALKMHKVNELLLGGGVIASARLRSKMTQIAKKFGVKIRYPYSKKLTGDNAAMIALAGLFRANKFGLSHNPAKGIYTADFETVDRDPSLVLSSLNDT